MEISPAYLSWPEDLTESERTELLARAARLLGGSDFSPGFEGLGESLHVPLAARLDGLVGRHRRPVVLGLEGAQGSGKTTLARALRTLLEGLFARRTIALSIDDFYLSRSERLRLSREVHPLFRTRGVPGTHDVPLAIATLDRLSTLGPGERTRVPVFDKGIDDRRPEADWPEVEGPVDLVLFEGWCVGVRPMPPESLAAPINALERERDPDGRWRAAIEAALETSYARLFERLDRLVVLVPPSFDVVLGWRREQERELRRQRGSEAGMSDEELALFVAHYERVTRWAIEDLPRIADLVVHLDVGRRPVSVDLRPSFDAEEGERRR